jgi:hypothetical protein
MKPSHALAALTTITLLAAPCLADIAPRGATEDCTLDKQCPDGATCKWKMGSVDSACEAAARGKGLERRCKSNGGSFASMIYCPGGSQQPATTTSGAPGGAPGAAPAASPPTTPPGSSGCGRCSVGGAPHAGLAPLWSLVAVLCLGRRRARAAVAAG